MRLSSLKVLFSALILLVVFFIQAFSLSSSTQELSLIPAINTKQITAEITSNGQYHGKSISIQLTNNTSNHIRIKIPAGLLFHPENEDEQTLIHIEDDFIVLKPKGKYSGNLTGFCTESSDRCPSSGSSMKVDVSKNPKFKKLASFLKGKDIQKSAYQPAIWAISDGHSVSDIEISDSTSKELRKYVATLTGQKDTWFSSPQHIQVDENGNIRRETVVITGQLEFTCKKNAQVRQDIYKENGESVLISDQSMTARYGKVTYKFTMRVKGWEKGKYYIKLHDGTNEITRYNFEV